MSNLRWKLAIVPPSSSSFSGWACTPSSQRATTCRRRRWLRDRQLKLGLDLKGGVHLVLRVQTDDALRVKTEQDSGRLQEELKRRSVPATVTIQDVTTFRVDGVPPAQDQAFRQAAEQESIDFERSTGTNGSYTFGMRPNIAQALREEAVVQARQTIERRVNELGVTEPSIAQQGADQILVQLPGVSDVDRAKEVIGSPGMLELKLVEQGPCASREDVLRAYGWGRAARHGSAQRRGARRRRAAARCTTSSAAWPRSQARIFAARACSSTRTTCLRWASR